MHIKSKIIALSFVILAACVPDKTGTSTAFAHPTPSIDSVETVSFAAFGSYMLYLQAKQDQDYDSAIRYLKQTIKQDPKNRSLIAEIVALLAIEGRVSDAAVYAKEELKLDPSSLLATLVLTVQNVKEGNYAEAERVLEVFPKRKENAFLIPLFEAWVYAGLKEPKKAIESLEAVKMEGTEALYAFHMALLYDMWDERKEAEKYYEMLIKEPGGLSLRAAQIYGNFLLRYGETKKFDALVDAYRRGNRSYPLVDELFFTAGAPTTKSKKIPKSIATPQEGLAEAFFDVSGSLADKGSPESSLFFVQFGLYLDPSLSLARVLLGEIFEAQGRYDEALKLYAEDNENSETYFSSQMRSAIILIQKDEPAQAEKILKALAKKRPDLPLPWIQLGDMYISKQNYKEAIKTYSEALERIPVAQSGHWMLYYSRGVAYERDKQWDLAEQDFLQALMLNPEQPLVLNYLGYSWLEKGKNIKSAKEMLELASVRAPRDGFITDSLGWAYYLLKEYKKSVHTLEKAVSQDPGSAVINDHLGDAYWRSGRQREARYQWQKALDIGGDLTEEDAKRIEAKLEKGLDIVGDKLEIPLEKKAPKTARAKKNAPK